MGKEGDLQCIISYSYKTRLSNHNDYTEYNSYTEKFFKVRMKSFYNILIIK